MKGDVSPQSVFHTNFHKGSRSQKAVMYPMSLKIDSLVQGISKKDAVLMKAFGTWSGLIALGLFSRQIEQNILAVKFWGTACKMSVFVFLERLLSSADWFLLQVCYLVLKVYVNSVCVSIHVPVDSLHGNCHIHHFDLKLFLILLFESCPPLEMFSDFLLIDKYCCRPSSPPVSSGPGCIGELLGDGHCSCPHTHLVFQRHTPVYFMGHCVSSQSPCDCVSPLGLV